MTATNSDISLRNSQRQSWGMTHLWLSFDDRSSIRSPFGRTVSLNFA
jgi:hypothetical protein